MEISDDKKRDLYLRKVARGELSGTLEGKPSKDKPWLRVYEEEDIVAPLPQMTSYNYLWENNKQHLNDCAINYFGHRITYRTLFEKIDEMAKAFSNSGIKKGDIVAICCANTPEIVYMFYALSKIGAVADIMDPRVNENVMLKYLNDVNTKLFICLDFKLPEYQNIIDKTSIETVVSLSPLESLPVPAKALANAVSTLKGSKVEIPKKDNFISFKDFRARARNTEEVKEVEYQKDMPTAIIHTGGTTGIPKGAILSNDNLNALVHQFRLTDMAYERGEKWLNLMPPFVSYGLANGIHLSLCSGMETILIPTYEPEKIADLLIKYKPNRVAGSPAHWEYFAHSPKIKKHDLSFLRRPIEGGDSINIELERKINDLLHEQNCNDNLTKGYGLSETCAALCVASAKVDNELLIGSVGFPLIDTVISVFEPNTTEELSYNEVGEICATGPNIMLGYHNRPAENAETLITHEDGRVWLHTGDLGLITEDGRIFHKGRIKRLIVRFDGTKIYSSDIEQVIASHPAVSLVSVVGVRDSAHYQGELPKAYIVLKPEYKNNSQVIEEIAKLCNDFLIDYMVPFAYEELPEMPYTGMGKVDFMKLKSLQQATNLEAPLSRVLSK